MPFAAIGNKQIALPGISRKGCSSSGLAVAARWCLAVPSDECLLQELTIQRKNLQTLITPVGYVNQAIIRHSRRVHNLELGRSLIVFPGSFGFVARCFLAAFDRRCFGAGGSVLWLIAEGAPHSLKRARVRIENDDTRVSVAVGDEEFIGLGIHELICWPIEVLSVAVSLALPAVPDLHQELSVRCEFENLVV